MKRKALTVLTILFAAIFVFSATNFVFLMAEYQKADKLYTEIQEEYVIPKIEQPVEGEDTSDRDNMPQDVPDISVDFAKLQAKNSDVVGWLYCKGTVINYPVVQAENNQKYLHKGLSGQTLRSGTLFVDYRNDVPTKDTNHIVYGHSMKDGSMFGMLLHYKKQSYYNAHPVMYYLTPEGNYRIELFAGRVIKTNSVAYHIQPSNDEWQKFLNTMKEKSTFKSDVTIGEQDKVVTLSTCSYEFDNARYVVLGKLIPIE